jgi:hypothetical protein
MFADMSVIAANRIATAFHECPMIAGSMVDVAGNAPSSLMVLELLAAIATS